MQNNTPPTKDRSPNTNVSYGRRIPVPSITLNKDDINSLKSILEKIGHPAAFNVVTDQEQIAFTDTQTLGDQKWPPNIRQFIFEAGNSAPNIEGYIRTPDQRHTSNVILRHNDRDWLWARTEELNRFLDQHRNPHHFFHNITWVVFQALFLYGLLNLSLLAYLRHRGAEQFIIVPLFLLYFVEWGLYATLLPKVFPFLVLEPEQPTFFTRLRTALKVLIPAIFAGLIAQAIRASLFW